MLDDLKEILVTEEQLNERLSTLGEEITTFYAKQDEVTIISVVNGAIPFTADLMRRIHMPLRLDSIRVSSYRDETEPVSEPDIVSTIRLDLKGRHVLLVDDILDTGSTLSTVVDIIKKFNPESIETCVLLEKKGRRKVVFKSRFVGFEIPDEFVVGYGLDFAERYRNLPCIGVLRPECQNPPVWR